MTDFDESESWFGDTDVDDIPDNPNELPNNTYRFRVISAELGKTKNRDNRADFVPKVGITFKYQIVEGAWSTFFPITEWVRVPDKGMTSEEKKKTLSYLKMRLLGFGFDREEVQKFSPSMVSECVNREFFGTTRSRKDKENRVQIKIWKFDPMTDGMVNFPDDDDM